MLQQLTIRNIALIEALTIDFRRGLHTLTGETGAGKSIIVDAVNLVLGARSDRSLIRTGAEKASVEALFDAGENPAVAAWLAAQGLESDGGVTLWREITAGGRSLCRVCGVVVPLSGLREVADLLMDVHGQHETRFLMDPQYHLALLDDAGDGAHQALRRDTAAACEAFLSCHRRYARLVRENQEKQARMEDLARSLEELKKAALKPGEEEQLREERERLRHAGKIAAALREAYGQIAAGDMEPALAKLKPAADALDGIAAYGEKYQQLAARVRSLYYELEEAGYELDRLTGEAAYDPRRAEAVETRLELISRLERRFGPDIPAVLAAGEKMQAEWDSFASLEGELTRLAAEDRALLHRYRELARALSASRRAIAGDFAQKMVAQLRDLGMAQTRFEAAFAPAPEKPPMPRPVGDDQVEFLLSPNPGEPLKPLQRIASGGELSRLMLALKNMEAARTGVDCMVFDEIDTGISGRVAQAVAEKLAHIARHRQVLCVTHLPQLAAMADVQLLVEKQVTQTPDGERTGTHVRVLTEEERVAEVARMLFGADGSTDSALRHAREMIDAARRMKAGWTEGDGA